VAGVQVKFQVTRGGGKVNGLNEVTVETGDTGHAEVNLTLGPLEGNNLVEADFPGNPGVPAAFAAFGLARFEFLPTRFSGIVLDNANQPIEGASCILEVPGYEGIETFTGRSGQFSFNHVPGAGAASIRIDGLRATHLGGDPGEDVEPGTFPVLTYETVLVPNGQNSLATPVLLPRLDPRNARRYSRVKDTILTIEGIEGLKMVVKAGSMKMNGQPAPEGHLITLNQVHHDDVPMPMPDGAAPPFAWTLQPAGATFDPPIQITYPNMSGLAPGAIAYFLSFNHDTNRFEIISSSHVTEDGASIVTDPGSGLSLAGWGCNCPPYSVTGNCGKCEPSFNGCGPAGQPDFVPDCPSQLLGNICFECFTEACNGHDRCYGTCGASKQACDEQFRDAMRSTCFCLGLADSLTCLALAQIYYRAVNQTQTGQDAYDAGQKEDCECEAAAGGGEAAAEPEPWRGQGGGPEPVIVDVDQDLLPDDYERSVGLNPASPADAMEDPDEDGLVNLIEFIHGTNPFDADSDNDGVDDRTQTQRLQPPPQLTLDGSWILTVNGQSVQANPSGTFTIANIAAPDQFGAGGPGSVPDFLSDNFVRVRGVSTRGGVTSYAMSECFRIRQRETFTVENLTITTTPPRDIESVRVSPDLPTLNGIGQTTQARVFATLAGGAVEDITEGNECITFRTSNTAIATIDANGLITARGNGLAFITAAVEGATAVAKLLVATGDPLTTISGMVALGDGAPVSGARVAVSGQPLVTTSGLDGSFIIPRVVTGLTQTLTVVAQMRRGSELLAGLAENVAPVRGGITDVGLITVASLTFADADQDGAADMVEAILGLDPADADTDNDGTPDGDEDADSDGLSDVGEFILATDPQIADTDGDGVRDGDEDADGDGLSDGEETRGAADGVLTNPFRADSDGDGMLDGYETRFRLNPLDASDAGADPDGDGLTNLQESQIDTDPFDPDRVPPSVASVDPPDGETQAKINTAIVVRFSERMRRESLNASTILLFLVDAGVTGTVTAADDGLSATLRPQGNLLTLTDYTLKVQNVRDKAGNVFVGPFTSGFRTSNQTDFTRPQVVSGDPEGQGAPINPVVKVLFSEPIDPATVTAATFKLFNSALGMELPGTRTVSASGLLACLAPSSPLAVGTQHYIQVTTGVLDLAGNQLSGASLMYFTTGFSPDTAPPAVELTDPADGAGAVPTNALLTVLMSEPVVPGGQITLRAGAVAVALGRVDFLDGDQRLQVAPAAPLAASTAHVLTVDGFRDRSGNALPAPVAVNFTTGAGTDTVRPTVLGMNPYANAEGVERDVLGIAEFSEPVNPVTVNADTIRFYSDVLGRYLDGMVTLDATRRVATVKANRILEPFSRNRLTVFGGITDTAGNAMSGTTVFFTTGGEVNDATAPQVAAASPPDALAGVPVNTKVYVLFSEPMNPLDVDLGKVSLRDAGGAVAATLALSDANRLLVLTPAASLAVSTQYTLRLDGLRDVAGNTLPLFISTFTTGASAAADTTAPSATVISPANGATGVVLSPPVSITFNERLNPTTVNAVNFQVTTDGFTGQGPATVSLDAAGTTVTINLLQPLLPSKQHRIRGNGLRDIAGNLGSVFTSFQTGAGALETTPPQVLLVTPADGAVDVVLNASVVLTFSEALDRSTLNANTCALFSQGAELGFSLLISGDNRVVTLDPSALLPAVERVTVVVTGDVKDLAGNRLPDFASSFTVQSALDTTVPKVAGQRPASGANGVSPESSVVVFFSEPVDPATIPGAIYVSENGLLKAGSFQRSAGDRAVHFLPAVPLAQGSLVELFVTTDLADREGLRLGGLHHTSFRVANPSGEAPDVDSSQPSCCAPIPKNSTLTTRFSEPIDPATITPATVTVKNANTNADIAGTRSLDASGRLFRFIPAAPFADGITVTVLFTTGVKDLSGTALRFVRGNTVVVGTDTDVQAPVVVSVSPADGSTGVGVNARLRVRFSESVNLLTVDGATISLSHAGQPEVPCTISFRDQDREVVIEPHAPLLDSTLYAVKVEGVTDRTGNSVVLKTTSFTTSAEPDLQRPRVLRVSPSGDGEPVNSVIVVEFDEPIDPASINAETFILYDNTTGQPVAGTRSVEASNRRAFFAPSANLLMARQHRVLVSSAAEDTAGNLLLGSNHYFRTGTVPDTTPPAVVLTDPASGDSQVPTNALLTIEMTEPVDPISVTGGSVELKRGVTLISGAFSFQDANRRIIFTSSNPLLSSAGHTLTIQGLKDTAGNVQAAPLAVGFTTGSGVDLLSPTVVTVTPANSSTGVPLGTSVTVEFSEPLDPITINAASVIVRVNATSAVVGGALSLDAARKVLTFTPAALLQANTLHRLTLSNEISDTAGNSFSGANYFFTTEP